MLKDRFKPSKFFIAPDLGASCLGWLAGFFAFAVVLGFLEQHKLIEVYDVLRRYVFQLFLIVAMVFIYRGGWRAHMQITRITLFVTSVWFAIYLSALWILNVIAGQYGFSGGASAPAFLLNDQLFLSALMAPIVEELFFRDLLFRTFLARWPRWWLSILATSFFFMIAHQSFYVGALLLGVVNSLLYIYSDSIVPGILFHSLCNLSWYFLPKVFGDFFEALRSGGWLNLFYHS